MPEDGPVKKEIIKRLEQAFAPTFLLVENQSEQHRGHAGYTDGESHFSVTITASALNNLNRVAQQRMVMAELKDMMPQPIHALVLQIR